ncbi:MAG: hypothetical protein OEM05_03700 [Myxococcales bacterium]|nr:hypothetical protein [Myxococcales bacterium]
MKRRDFLVGGVIAAAAAAAGVAQWLMGRGGDAGPRAAPDPTPPASPPRDAAPAAGAIFPSEDHALLLMVADLIVPREGVYPAASETDLIPRLEAWGADSPSRRRIYVAGWPELKKMIGRLPSVDGLPDTRRLARRMRAWHRRFRRRRRGGRGGVNFFEQLRRDVLRLYYASPAGAATVGYIGPVHRPQPGPASGA